MKKSKKIGLVLSKKVISKLEKGLVKGGEGTGSRTGFDPTYPFCVTGSHCACK